MSKTLVCVYDNLTDAEKAREALISTGFPAEKVHVTVHDDEAGAVEGNFCVGNARTATTSVGKFFDSLIHGESARDDYDQNYAKAIQRGNCVLIVEAQNDTQLEQARGVTSRYNPIGPK